MTDTSPQNPPKSATATGNDPAAILARFMPQPPTPRLPTVEDPLGVADLVAKLEQSLEEDVAAISRDMLHEQAHILHTLFNRMLTRDVHNGFTDDKGIPYLDVSRLALALRSQRQCLSTMATLARLRRMEAEDEATT